MLICFDGQPHNISCKQTAQAKLAVGLISTDELSLHYSDFGMSYSDYIELDLSTDSFRSSVKVTDKSLCFPLKSGTVCDQSNEARCLFYLRKGLALIILIKDENRRLRDSFFKAVNGLNDSTKSIEKFVYLLLNGLISDDGKNTEKLESNINTLEEAVISGSKSTNINEEILIFNKSLMQLRNYYEQIIDISERLYENENGLFDGSYVTFFKSIEEKASRLCAEVNLLRENLVRIREAYQARIDLKMNSTMKFFTVITTLFLPLTLITGWYGMNFQNMPELSSPYGYPAVIAVSVTVVLICILIFRKKKLF